MQYHERAPSRPDTSRKSRSAPGSLETARHVPVDIEEHNYCLGEREAKTLAVETELGPAHSTRPTDKTSDGTRREYSHQSGKEETEGNAFVAHWATTGLWPENFASMSQKRSDSPKKRSHSSSYSQSFKDGEVPRAHSQAYELLLAENGVHMEELKGRSLVQKESKILCGQLLQSKYPEPQHTAFPLSEFLAVWQRAQNRNEARVYRDITPLLVPSPELLSICGVQELEYVAEEIGAEWSKCKTLGGPKPKPDLAIGISASAFSEEEVAKLKNHTAPERPTLFTDHMYFPFLLCEVKCGNEGINRADRQNMHSSSLAVKAIVELFQALDSNQAAQLHGQILVFSVSHDNERVKLYGHFPVLEGDRTAFYRYPIASFDLNFEENQGRKRTHDFVRAIYRTFFPEHVNRVRTVLSKMEDPRSQSMYSDMSVEEIESLGETTSAQSSQELIGFKKPDAPASKKRKGEMALLREQLAEQQKQNKEQQKQNREQLADQQKTSKEQMAVLERQLEAQKKQSEEQLELMKEQVKMLRQLLDRR